METADKIEIVKGMKVWICPVFDRFTPVSHLEDSQEEHIVIDTLNNCMVYTRIWLLKDISSTYPTYHRLTVFADKKKAIHKRIALLEEIIDKKKKILKNKIEEEEKEINATQNLKNSLDKEIST